MKSFIKPIAWTGLMVIIAVAAYTAYVRWIKIEPLPQGLIQANGRIEGDHVTIASKFQGRINELLVREGDAVKKGQVVAVLDDSQIRARVKQARKALAVIAAQVKAAQTSLALLKKEVPLSIKIAEDGVAHARARIEEAEASEQQAKREAARYRELFAYNAASEQAKERTDLAFTVAQKGRDTSRIALKKAKENLASAELGWIRITVKEDELNALKAEQERAWAVLEEAESVLDDLTIVAPSQGMITTRVVDQGEVVNAGTPLLDLVDLDRLYLKVYVAEYEIGKLRLGLQARIHTDAFPDRPFEAVVRYIASRAEFTPKEVQTPDERVKLVYAVKLYLADNPDHCLSPGMPADAVIRWKEETPWAQPRW